MVSKSKKNKLKFSFKDYCKKFVLTVFEFKWFVIFFIPFLFFQLFRIVQINWDTTAYIFGGKWFCGNPIYFEFIRPPLPAFLNCLSGAGDYSMILTTLFACFVYLAALILIFLKNKNKLSQFIFAFVAFLFPAILFNFNYGSDLLALSFLLLAFAVTSPIKKGLFFGLSTLSRYNFFIFILVLTFELRKKPKDLIKLIVPIVLVWIPWLIYNYLFTGNPVFSVYESSYLNVQMKGVMAPFSFDQIIVVSAFFIILILFKIKEKLSQAVNQAAILNIIIFVFSGIKEMRFLSLLTPALAFNLALLSKKRHFAKIVIFILMVFSLWFVGNLFISELPYESVSVPQDDFIHNCRVASDKWVFFYYEGVVAETSYDIGDWNKYISNGGSFVLYDYKGYDLNSFKSKIVNRGDYIIIKSDSCAPQPKKYISGSLRKYVVKWLRDSNSNFYDYSDWAE